MDTVPGHSVPLIPEKKLEQKKHVFPSSGTSRVLKMRNLLILGVILLVSWWLAMYSPLFHKAPPPGIHLTDLHSVNQLQGLFDANPDMPRLVLIYSPTCAICIRSANWLQRDVLDKYPDAKLRVYAIWTNQLVFDSRSQWDAAGLTDRRVVHLWDPQDIVGNWFFYQLSNYQGPTWDTYLLFGKNSTWANLSSSLIGSGGTVEDQEGRIMQSLSPLLKENK